MADPVKVACTADTWVKVATNVTSITPRIIDNSPDGFSWTYIATTGAAPTDLSEAVPLKDGETLAFAAGSDVYVYAHNKTGQIRIDS